MSARGTHYAAGAVAGLAVGQVGMWTSGWPVTEAVACGAVGLLSGPGMDMDQRGWFRALDRAVPDEWMGEGGPLSHRGITHWVMWGPLMALGWWWVLGHGPAALGVVSWVGWGVSAGWASHTVMDAFYGHAVHTPEGILVVRRGVPLFGWYMHRGGVWTSSGPGSAFAGFVLSLVACWQVIGMAGGAGQARQMVAGHFPVVVGLLAVVLLGVIVDRPARRRRPERGGRRVGAS